MEVDTRRWHNPLLNFYYLFYSFFFLILTFKSLLRKSLHQFIFKRLGGFPGIDGAAGSALMKFGWKKSFEWHHL